MTLQKKQSTSTITTMEYDIKAIAHGVGSSTDPIRFHDDTEQQDVFELARQKNFQLDIPEEDPLPTTKFRLKRKSFAIACQTTMSKKCILEHIQDLFYKRIQYVCISSPRNPSSNPRVVYIQIILHKVMNKKVYFMEGVAGMRCNYRVTCDDRSWNQFLKKVGPYLEVGKFYPAGPRRCCTLNRDAQQKPWESERIVKSTTRSSTTKTVTPVANDTATNVTSDVKPCLRGIIDVAFEYIAAECARQREILIQQFASNHDAQ